MNKIKDVFLDIISIIREEQAGKEYRYYTGDTVKITLNGVDVKSLDSSLFTEKAKRCLAHDHRKQGKYHFFG